MVSKLQRKEEIEKELARLKAKLMATTDEDIRSAIELKISSLEAELVQVQHILEQESRQRDEEAERIRKQKELESQQRDPRQVAQELEGLLRQAALQLRQNHLGPAKKLIAEAEKLDPNNIELLELKADVLVADKKYAEATNVLKWARKIDPTSVRVERKLAETVLRVTPQLSIEDQLRLGHGDVLRNDPTVMQNRKVAITVNLCVPGGGHILIGQNGIGIGTIVVWVIGLIIVATLPSGNGQKQYAIQEVISMIGGQSANPPATILLVLFLMMVIYVGSNLQLNSQLGIVQKKETTRPEPPVNLPFE